MTASRRANCSICRIHFFSTEAACKYARFYLYSSTYYKSSTPHITQQRSMLRIAARIPQKNCKRIKQQTNITLISEFASTPPKKNDAGVCFRRALADTSAAGREHGSSESDFMLKSGSCTIRKAAIWESHKCVFFIKIGR